MRRRPINTHNISPVYMKPPFLCNTPPAPTLGIVSLACSCPDSIITCLSILLRYHSILSKHFTFDILTMDSHQLNKTPPVRRQNQSCDQCRHSKRRCEPSDTSETGTQPTTLPCRNCSHLRYTCTYDFAKQRQNERSKKPQQRRKTATSLSTSIGGLGQASVPEAAPIRHAESHAFSPVSRQRPSQPESEAADASQLSTTPSITTLLTPQTFEPVMHTEMWAPWDTIAFDWQSSNHLAFDSLLCAEDVSLSFLPTLTAPVVDNASTDMFLDQSQVPPNVNTSSATNSPMTILFSSFELGKDNDDLFDVYKIATMGLKKWFLNSESNQFCASAEYHLDVPSEDSTRQSSLHPESQTTQQTDSMEAEDTDKIHRHTGLPRTVINIFDVCRFLDHVSPLMGNSISLEQRERTEALLKATIIAFAKQYMPPDTEHIYGYVESLQKARRLVQETAEDLSFVQIYASLLLSMLPDEMPYKNEGQAASKQPVANSSPKNLVQNAFHNMRQLVDIFAAHCASMQPSSKYRQLIETGVKILRWFMFVRETMTNLTSQAGSTNTFSQDFAGKINILQCWYFYGTSVTPFGTYA